MSKPISLFLFAHQDDELFVWNRLRAALQANADGVRCVYLTDGGQRLSARRKQECLTVLKTLGVDPLQVWWIGIDHGIPDMSLVRYVPKAIELIQDRLREMDGHIHSLVAPAWEGGHPDHDAAALIAHRLERQAPSVEHFSLYNGYWTPGPVFWIGAPVPANGRLTRSRIPARVLGQMIARVFWYRSQKKAWLRLFPVFLLRYLLYPYEILQEANTLSFPQPPHAGALLYERHRRMTFAEFLEAV